MFLQFVKHIKFNFCSYKIFDSISTYGDYDLQVTLIETIFRMYGKNAIASKITDLIPESQELSESFANINGSTFDEDVRRFLNSVNKNSKKIFSVICKDIFLGDIKCGQPMVRVENVLHYICYEVSFASRLHANRKKIIEPRNLNDYVLIYSSHPNLITMIILNRTLMYFHFNKFYFSVCH